MANFFLIISVLPILFYKAIDDFRFRKIIANNRNIFTDILYLLHIIFLGLFIIRIVFDFLDINLNLVFFNSYILLVLILVLTFTKRLNSIFIETLEYHYEGLVYLALTTALLSQYNASVTLSCCILITSISAGMCKLKCDLWKPNGTGFLRFLVLPWSSRKCISKFSTEMYRTNKTFKNVVKIIHLIVPWIQISSGFLLIFFKLIYPNSYGIIISLTIQILFSALLFIIADLSWIPFFYGWLCINFAFLPFNYDSNLNIAEYSAIIFLLTYIYRVFTNFTTKPFIKFFRVLSVISMANGEFSMFTERNVDNMITHYITHPYKLSKYNAFDPNGYRNKSQNLCSRHLFCTLYTLGDFITLNSEVKNKYNDFNFKSAYNKKQCFHIFKAIKTGTIHFFQHKWNDKSYSYESKMIAELKISMRGNAPYQIYLKNHSTVLLNRKR